MYPTPSPSSGAAQAAALQFHPLADVFPLLGGAEFDDLVESIRTNGQREPITYFEGKILDGRNRYRACQAAGVEPHGGEFHGSSDDARQFVIDANIRRRHMDASQRAMAATKLANMRQGARTDLEHSANLPEVSQSEAASLLNVSERSVRSARRVLDDGVPELVQAVEQGAVKVSAAAEIASLPKGGQVITMARLLLVGKRASKARRGAAGSAKFITKEERKEQREEAAVERREQEEENEQEDKRWLEQAAKRRAEWEAKLAAERWAAAEAVQLIFQAEPEQLNRLVDLFGRTNAGMFWVALEDKIKVSEAKP